MLITEHTHNNKDLVGKPGVDAHVKSHLPLYIHLAYTSVLQPHAEGDHVSESV